MKTIDDFENHLRLYPNVPAELIGGHIIEKTRSEEHSLIAGNIFAELRAHVKANDLGRVAFEVRRQIPGDEHNARLPDVEFTSKDRLLPIVKTGAVPQMPDFAIEVKSPTDTYIGLREKAIYYLKNGARLVWLVYPDKQQVEVHTTDSVHTLDADDTLDGGDVLPDFKIAVSDVFAE